MKTKALSVSIHASIILSLVFLTFEVLDYFNPFMAFTSNEIAQPLLALFCFCSLINAVVLLITSRKKMRVAPSNFAVPSSFTAPSTFKHDRLAYAQESSPRTTPGSSYAKHPSVPQGKDRNAKRKLPSRTTTQSRITYRPR